MEGSRISHLPLRSMQTGDDGIFACQKSSKLYWQRGQKTIGFFKLKDFMPMGFGPGNLEERQEKNETAKTDICYCN